MFITILSEHPSPLENGRKDCLQAELSSENVPLVGKGEKCNLSLFIDLECPKGNIKVL
jgi:hypothetical protein